MRADALLRLLDGDNPGTEIVAHVSAEALAHDSQGALAHDTHAGCCELEGGAALAPETARRLARDAALVRLTEDAEGGPLEVGRRTRSIPPAIRRAKA